MANLGICQKCPSCLQVLRAVLDDDDKKVSGSQVWCDLSDPYIGWDSEVPEKCPFRMEHMVSKDAVVDLAEEAIEFKETE